MSFTYLSKSDFLKYLDCPNYLWLYKNKKEVLPPEEYSEQRTEQGYEIEGYARQLFPNGIMIHSFEEHAQQETQRLVAEGVTTIFQGTVITSTGLLAMADILTYDKESQSWTIHEVKSTNTIKEQHLNDLAFQRVAFEDAGYKIGKTTIIHLNKEYVRIPEVAPSELLIEEDVTSQVEKLIPTIRLQAYEAFASLSSLEEPEGCSCREKTKAHHCPGFEYLNPDIPEYSIYDLTHINSKTLIELMHRDIYLIPEIPSDIKLNTVQRNQVQVAITGQPIIDREGISSLLGELEYPLYFFDYETIATALPLYDKCHPYQQIPFQYSLHLISEPGSKIEHFEFLGRSIQENPMLELLENLKKQIGPSSNIIVWYKSFESSRNTEMGKLYPEYAEFLADVNSRIFDLMDIFKDQLFVHPDFRGSNSIKHVLPVLAPELSYKELDVQNGEMAAARWHEAVSGKVDGEKANETFESLLTYCGLDTFAMVRIYEYLLTTPA